MKHSSEIFTRRIAGAALGLMISLIVIALAGAGMITPASASPDRQEADCLACHQQEGMETKLKSGGILRLTIDPALYRQSVHGLNDISCAACHSEITEYPHPANSAVTLREESLKYYQACKQCHAESYDKQLDSIHQTALINGNSSAALCSDCHDPHAQKPMNDLKQTDIPLICAQCHNAIYQKYQLSVHGSALIAEDNRDVPTCVDCHSVHNIQNLQAHQFRLNTPDLCAKCHTDEALMSKYEISTNVMSTYVSDFHGATVSLLRDQAANVETLKPVCTDCHGIHDILRADDPEKGIAASQNLLVKCQVCHPDATEALTASWTSHYIPDAETYPYVYYVNVFYAILIPGVLGGMAIFVFSDAARRLIERFVGKGEPHA
jgi:predicted CXXCH cytochrome family protein